MIRKKDKPFLDEVVQDFKDLGINDEEIVYILQKAGKEYSVFHQLIMTLPKPYINAEITESFQKK